MVEGHAIRSRTSRRATEEEAMPCVAKGRVISVVGENDVAGETDALFEFAGCLAKGRTQRRSVSLLADRCVAIFGGQCRPLYSDS